MYHTKRKKLFIEFFFPRFIFQSRVRNFFAIARVIEGAYYIANYKKKTASSCKTQDKKNTEEFNKYFCASNKKKEGISRRRFPLYIFKYTSLNSWLFHAIPLDQSLIFFDYKYKKNVKSRRAPAMTKNYDIKWMVFS